jgi:hypothetical protein
MPYIEPEDITTYDLLMLQAHLEDTLNHTLSTWQITNTQSRVCVNSCEACGDLVYVFLTSNTVSGQATRSACRGYKYMTVDEVIDHEDYMKVKHVTHDSKLDPAYCEVCGAGTTLVGRGCWNCKVGNYGMLELKNKRRHIR